MTAEMLAAVVRMLDGIYAEHQAECGRAEDGLDCFDHAYYEKATLDAADRLVAEVGIEAATTVAVR